MGAGDAPVVLEPRLDEALVGVAARVDGAPRLLPREQVRVRVDLRRHRRPPCAEAVGARARPFLRGFVRAQVSLCVRGEGECALACG